jgi:class 3 adenylate cyclase/alpha-beta hydrolase superfamily lysophospholipase
MDVPETRYAKTTDGVHIAYQVRGRGPIDLVLIMGYTANFEVELELPGTISFYDRLASLSRLILFDKRGTGLSDRHQTPDLDMRADDLRAVLDAVGTDRAVLLGHSEGGQLGVFFAAAHPDRVIALVLYGSGARNAWAPDYPFGMTEEEHLAERVAIESSWGTLEHAERWMAEEAPSFVGDAEVLRWWAKAERFAASPGAALEFEDVWFGTDVRSVLGSVQAPTLVLCRPAAAGQGEESSRYLADRIPGSRYEELSGRDYSLSFGNTEEFFVLLEEFLGSVRSEEAQIDRVLATVLFTDIVGSTERAAEAGDRAWRQLLERHHQTVRAMLGRYRGREIDTAGDGFFATFDGPARGVRCARAIVEAVRPLGLEVRLGLHTGEVETIDDKVGGIAVSIGARIASLAEPGQVVVSQTVRDLVVGSGLAFEDAGEHELKGVPDRWRLYRAVD